MLKKAKQLFLIIPVLLSLFTLSSFNKASASSISFNNELSNITTAQVEVKPQVYSNATETYTFYLFGCFYYLSTTRDNSGQIVCQEAITACGSSVSFHANGDLTQCEDD